MKKRAKKLVATYLTIREKAQRFVKMFPEDYTDFVCSDHWIRNVCRRHNICSRKLTHISQQQTMMNNELLKLINDFLRSLKQKSVCLSYSNIYNIDETACYFDM